MRAKITMLLVGILAVLTNGVAQSKSSSLLAGPMLGHTDLRTTTIWLQFEKGVTAASISYRRKQDAAGKMQTVSKTLSGNEFNTTVFTIGGLEPGTTYSYYISAGQDKRLLDSGEITTQSLWQYRTPAPDFSFLTGSCAYFNEPPYDRPGKPYGNNDSAIFYHMGREKANMMLWLGDNWYTREVDYHSAWGLFYRASHDRQVKVMKPLLKSMPQYAIWDDHDYGPNDADRSYHLKESARDAFTSYWANPSYGENNQGIYTRFRYNDVDFFLLDARWWRSNDHMKDSVDGRPNPDKKMFGSEQMEWLKNSLLYSNSMPGVSFRVIVTGSQVLNQYSLWDSFRKFPAEYADFMKFLADNKIEGVVFITGDRHHSEVIRLDRKEGYPLFDVTVSPLTSSAAKTTGAEINNPGRVSKETDVQNYGRISISGQGADRLFKVEIISFEGEVVDTWQVKAGELKW